MKNHNFSHRVIGPIYCHKDVNRSVLKTDHSN